MIFSRSLVAIDIGSSAVKLLEVAGPQHSRIKSIGAEKLPSGAVHDGLIQDPPVVRAALKRLIRRLGISTFARRVSLSLSGSSVMIKKIVVLRKDDSTLEEQVFFEAEQQFQHNLADLYYNHYVMTPNPDEHTQVAVVLAAAKRELVEQYVTLIRSTGLRTGVIDCAVFAATNMFEFNYGLAKGFIALVNVGANLTLVSLFNNGEYLYTREVATGGEEYSRKIMGVTGMSRDEAESLKIALSLGASKMDETLQPAFAEASDTLVCEIQTTIDYYLQTGEAPPQLQSIDHIFLTGGGAYSLGLDAAIAASLQRPVHIVNPFKRFDIGTKPDQVRYVAAHGHMFSVALGLALRKMYDEVA